MAPLVLINAAGLTHRWLPNAPRFGALAYSGWCHSLQEVLPAVTCTAQTSILTGQGAASHGIVGNGWFFRDTGEVRFWQQSNRLIEVEPFYETARRVAAARKRPFRSAKLFWWFNQGAAVDFSVTPKPFYGADGNKALAIQSTPAGLAARLESQLGSFPFSSFWGPLAGLPATEWIAACAAEILRDEKPDLTLVYLPHLDYDPQRYGPQGCDMAARVRELDAATEPLLDAARSIGARVWIVSEYGHVDVRSVVEPNRALRRAGLLAVRSGPFGENLDTFASGAFAVCDHQIAHVYVREPSDLPRVRELIEVLPGVARVLDGPEKVELELNHNRSGELIALSEPDSYFAYHFWLDDCNAPDYARTVDIHRKPGYDPCELILDPSIRLPRLRAGLRLLQKKMGFRTLFDLVPLDPHLVKGSHGLRALDPLDRPVLIGDGPDPGTRVRSLADIRRLVLQGLDLMPENETPL
jgi:predicted AlkP superfamily pyrophosphatase or phosphodiesterase